MTFEKAFVLEKLREMGDYVKEVEELFVSSDKEILADTNKLHTAERLLQLVVDTIIDINQHFIKEKGLPISEDFQSTFYTLGDNDIVPQYFAKKIAPVVGLRNRIVHRYDTIDTKLFIKEFRKNYNDFLEYMKLVSKHLQ